MPSSIRGTSDPPPWRLPTAIETDWMSHFASLGHFGRQSARACRRQLLPDSPLRRSAASTLPSSRGEPGGSALFPGFAARFVDQVPDAPQTNSQPVEA